MAPEIALQPVSPRGLHGQFGSLVEITHGSLMPHSVDPEPLDLLILETKVVRLSPEPSTCTKQLSYHSSDSPHGVQELVELGFRCQLFSVLCDGLWRGDAQIAP
jgi:hypothetical protein